jgi:hypothetical protein
MPKGEWMRYSIRQLTNIIIELKEKLDSIDTSI